jgi:hypothetical protein
LRACLAVLLAALALAAAPPVWRAAGDAAPPLDLAGYKMSFDEEFARADIVARGAGGVWIAHTPWHGDFGDDVFGDPGPGGPFSLTPGGLAITARKGAGGKWQGGLICSRDADGPGGTGFAQLYGYFEMEAKLPAGAGVWPAFWLEGIDKTKSTAEIDVMEYYGHAEGQYHITAHNWVGGKDVLGQWHVVDVPAGQLTSRFNDYGVLITAATTRFYFNRREIWSMPTPPEYRQPMYLLADLAIGGGWPYAQLASPRVMLIRRIRAFRAPS